MNSNSECKSDEHVTGRSTTRNAVLLTMALAPAVATAQTTPSATSSDYAWRYSVSIYGYLPSMSGSTSAPTSGGGLPINVSVDQILDKLQFTAMGAFEAHNGRWGGFTDFIYLDLGGNKQGFRDFTVGDTGPAPGSAASIDWNLKGVIWTVAGEYRVIDDGAWKLDVLAGARMFQLRESLDWAIVGDLGTISPTARFGNFEGRQTLWDGIVGIKGQYTFGPTQRWSMPFYLDVGTGQSKLTWQAAAGVSYAYPWGELTAMWRYIAYDMKSDKNLKELNFSGPMLGATFRW